MNGPDNENQKSPRTTVLIVIAPIASATVNPMRDYTVRMIPGTNSRTLGSLALRPSSKGLVVHG